ncbi:MAG: hypothetical protein ACK2UR_20305 [Candidatus Promineifilaceae bacterium]|jgi:hypothetical protein
MSKLFPIVLILVIVLAACGGEGETAVAPTPAETAVEMPQEEAVPTEEVVPPTEAPPTEMPPTEAPAVEETAPADVQQDAGETAVADSGEGWGESGTTAQSACDHPYFPLRTGMNWTVDSGDGVPITWEVVRVDGDMQKATAEVTMSSADLEFTYIWECTADGGISSYEFSNVGLPALGPEVQIEVTEGSGFFLPDPASLEPGYSWDTSFHTSYSMTQLDTTADDIQLVISGEMDTRQTSTVVNMDPVTFQDMTVPGLLIQQDTEIDTVMEMMGESVENSLFMGGEIEFGRGWGIVRQTSFTDFGDYTMEVTDIFVP